MEKNRKAREVFAVRHWQDASNDEWSEKEESEESGSEYWDEDLSEQDGDWDEDTDEEYDWREAITHQDLKPDYAYRMKSLVWALWIRAICM